MKPFNANNAVMKRAIEIIFMASVMLGILGLITYAASCLMGWKFAIAWIVLSIVLFFWIANDIRNCAIEDENGNIVMPPKKSKNKEIKTIDKI